MSQHPNGHNRTKIERENDLHRLAQWFAIPGNDSLRAAARALELSFNTVKRDWLELLRRYAEEDKPAVEARRQLKVNEYRHIEREAYDAWQRSKENKERKTVKRRTAAAGQQEGEAAGRETKEAVTLTEGRLPANEYLQTILDCKNRICELERVNPPRETILTGGTDPINVAIVEIVKPATELGNENKPQ